MAHTDERGLWRIAAADPDHVAVVDPDHAIMTFGELAVRSNQIANGLLARGLTVGDQVTTLLPNSFEQVAVGMAAYQCGFYLTTVNWHLVGPEISYIVNDADTSALIVHDRFAAEATRVLDDCVVPPENRLSVGLVEGFRPLDELIEGQAESRPADLATGSYMFYTSGTTGRPKGVRRALDGRHPDEAAAESGALMSLFGTTAHDDNVHLTQAPMYHTAANGWTSSSLHLGHTVVLMDKWSAEGVLERIDRHRVTHTHMVPTMFNRLLRLGPDERDRFDVSSLRQVIHAAAPCPVETKRQMIRWWGDTIWEYYAATEGGGTIIGAAEWLAHPGSVGRPWPGSEVVIVGEDDEELPPGEVGTIYMLTPGGRTFEYRGDDEKTAAGRRRDLFTVGDVGYLDHDGYLFLSDRRSDMIIAGGVNIYPAEIEGTMVQHEAVVDVAVFGIPDPDLGEQVKAVVELAPGWSDGAETTEVILTWLGGQIAAQKLPRSIDYTTDMPRDPSGKLYKRRLRDRYWEGHERAI